MITGKVTGVRLRNKVLVIDILDDGVALIRPVTSQTLEIPISNGDADWMVHNLLVGTRVRVTVEVDND